MLYSTADNLRYEGESRRAWKDREQALALLGQIRNPRRRHAALTEAALASSDERMPYAALHFETALVDMALAWARQGPIGEALTRRAVASQTLGAHEPALSDIRESRRWIAQMEDAALAARHTAEVDAAEGEILTSEQPEVAARSVGRALAYFETK